MAKLECTLNEDFDALRAKIEKGVLDLSATAHLENTSNFIAGTARCSVMVFERYSVIGNNRVSMSVTMFQDGNGPIQLSAITSGGSQAVIFKINTIGEETFLETLQGVLGITEDYTI